MIIGNLREELLDFVNSRLNSMLALPGMWGPNIAVETQIFLLLEIRNLAYGRIDKVSSDFNEFVDANLEKATSEPLSVQLEKSGRSSEFILFMKKFVDGYGK